MELIDEADVERELLHLDKVDAAAIYDTKMFSFFLADELALYTRKREDYGKHPMEETGIIGLMVRILDKVHRVVHLSENGKKIEVEDENLKDTLMDIANYANMALLEMEKVRIKKWRIE